MLQENQDKNIKDSVQVFKSLSDKSRLHILLLLSKKELNVSALCKLLNKSQPFVSHHLTSLRKAGLIKHRKEGRYNFYHTLDNFEIILNKASKLFIK
jgi:ArsR family transcriptional regulator